MEKSSLLLNRNNNMKIDPQSKKKTNILKCPFIEGLLGCLASFSSENSLWEGSKNQCALCWWLNRIQSKVTKCKVRGTVTNTVNILCLTWKTLEYEIQIAAKRTRSLRVGRDLRNRKDIRQSVKPGSWRFHSIGTFAIDWGWPAIPRHLLKAGDGREETNKAQDARRWGFVSVWRGETMVESSRSMQGHGKTWSSEDEKVSINKVWIKDLTSDPSSTWD